MARVCTKFASLLENDTLLIGEAGGRASPPLPARYAAALSLNQLLIMLPCTHSIT